MQEFVFVGTKQAYGALLEWCIDSVFFAEDLDSPLIYSTDDPNIQLMLANSIVINE